MTSGPPFSLRSEPGHSVITRVKLLMACARAMIAGPADERSRRTVQPHIHHHVTAARARQLTALDIAAMSVADVVAYAGDIHGELLDYINPAAVRICLHDTAEQVVLERHAGCRIVKISTR